MHRSSSTFEAVPALNLADIKDMMATAPAGHIDVVLTACLARLDALNAQLAAVHLATCLDTLRRDFNLD